jgi:hypothetical protein
LSDAKPVVKTESARSATDSNELGERLQRLRARLAELRGRL